MGELGKEGKLADIHVGNWYPTIILFLIFKHKSLQVKIKKMLDLILIS